MASKVNSSPGVYMTEKDLTFSVQTVGVTTLGLVGETKKGPAFQPFFIKSYDDFKTFFGGASAEKFQGTQIPKYELPYIAKAYLTQSNQLFVTRVLGLSGYNAGPAWVIRTLGAPEVSELDPLTDGTITTRTFSATTSGDTLTTGGVSIQSAIATFVGVDLTLIEASLTDFFAVGGPFTTSEAYWGDIESLTAGTAYDLYNLPSAYSSSQLKEHWVTQTFTYNTNTNVFNGVAFRVSTTSTGPSTYNIDVMKYSYTVNPIAEWNKKVVTILRSKASYVGFDLVFGISGNTVNLSGDVSKNAYTSFNITGTNSNNTPFSYNVSLNPNEKNYIKNVIGSASGERATELWVEEAYDTILAQAIAKGQVIGLSGIEYTTDYAHYKLPYQSPTTPYIVSELRGGHALRLFRFISISDGETANTEIKISIANIDLAKKTFDVQVRVFIDDDRKPSIIERFAGCTMNPNDDNYIGRRIGTSNEYDMVSSYVLVDIADNAPIDAVPAGFEGYPFRSLDELNVTPKVPYKTKYYAPNEVTSQTILGNPKRSPGDKVKKIYLGFATGLDADVDLLKFNGADLDGNEWPYTTNGFHMDANADQTKFSVGASGFTDAVAIAANSDHPYYSINARKFTVAFSGGFDGWDIYRESRTNTDTYKIGATGFVQSGFDQTYFPEYDEYFGTSDYYAYLNGIKTFINPETVTINILATPGIDVINNTELVKETIEMVEEKRQDSIYLPTLPDITLLNNASPSNVDNWLYPNDIINLLEDAQIDSNYTAVYYPWIQILDSENNTNIFIPPTSEVIRNLALTDNVAHPWYATAGYSRGLVNAKKTRIKLDQEQRDILYNARINPIAADPSVGNVIWGNRNLQELDSALNRINIRRLLLQAKKLVQAVSKRLLFDPNDETIRSEFLSSVNPILNNIRKERGLYDFRVKVASDAIDLDSNTMKGKIYLKPTKTLEYIELEFNLTPTSVSFDSIS